jgi:hypothetical protein
VAADDEVLEDEPPSRPERLVGADGVAASARLVSGRRGCGKLNGPAFTWPLMMFAGVAPERLLKRFGRLHVGRPLTIRSRKELLATIKPHQWRHLRADTGDLPDEFTAPPAPRGGTFIRLTRSRSPEPLV